MDKNRMCLCACILSAFSVSAFADTKAISPPPVVSQAAENTNAVELTVPPNRGELLFENHCLSCHESVVYVRDTRKAKNIADIRVWVVRWSEHLKLDWRTDEVNDVVDYVNQRFYQFDK